MVADPVVIGAPAAVAPTPNLTIAEEGESQRGPAAASPKSPKEALPVLLQQGAGPVRSPLEIQKDHEVQKEDVEAGQKDSRAPAKAAASPPPYMYFIATCAALNSCNLGYDIGVSSGVGLYIEEELRLNEFQVGLFFGALHFVAAAGGLASQGLSDRLGRRLTFTVAQAVNIVGISLICFAQSFGTLMAGRVIVGIGVGIGLSIDPLYIAEAAPAAHRGKLTTWSELAINFGIMLGFVANWAFEDLPAAINWRVMVGCGALLPFVLVVLSLTAMPESPRWLACRGREEEAAAVIKRTHPAGEDVNAIMEEMKRGIAEEEARERVGWKALLQPDGNTRWNVLVGLGITIAQQINGSESVIFYSPTIFKRAHVATTKQALFKVTILVGLIKTFFVGLSACFLDNAGRRPLLIVSTSCMAVSLALLSVSSGLGIGWLAVIGVLSFVAAFSLGIGPVCWLLPAELFPLHVRAKAMSLGVFLNRMTSATVALTFLPLSDALGGQAGYFGLFAVVTAGTAAAAFFLVPETKRLSLEQLAAGKASS